MDKLPSFGRGIDEVLVPTFGAYEELLKAKEAEIRSAQRETHKYGPHPRHHLDVYFPDNSPPASGRRKVLVFLHGGGFFAGSRVNEAYAGGLIFGNIGRYFTAKYGVTVVVPDYRLISHGAKYPSGGEDIALVVDWISSTLATREGYGDGIDLFLLGNSAGGVHVATFLIDAVFAKAREDVLSLSGSNGVRLRGAIFLGTPVHWAGYDDENIKAYLGPDTVRANSPIGKLEETIRETGSAPALPHCKVLILLSELDPELLFVTARDLEATWQDQYIEIQVLEGHNHISPQLGLGTGIEREEAWGEQVATFLTFCVGD
jgi:carboxylesterase type B